MTFAEHRAHYRKEHSSLGCRLTHMFGVPMITASLIAVFFSFAWFLVLFTGGWALQLLGHFVFEKNRPVLFSNPKNPFTYFYAMVFVAEEWWRLITGRKLTDD